MNAALPLTEILERDWDRQLFATGRKPGLATQLGWHSHWTFDSRGSAHGFPDPTVCRDRVLFVELKRELTASKAVNRQREPSAQQVVWLDRLAKPGAETYLWRPSDLEEIALILSNRWQLLDGVLWREGLRLGGDNSAFRPRSLWIPGIGRADSLANVQQTIDAA